MKTCPKCSDNYDDSWGICFNDQTKLIDGTSTNRPIPRVQKLPAIENLCPCCKETIKKDARRCPHCREELGLSGALNTISSAAFWLFILLFAIPGLLLALGLF